MEQELLAIPGLEDEIAQFEHYRCSMNYFNLIVRPTVERSPFESDQRRFATLTASQSRPSALARLAPNILTQLMKRLSTGDCYELLELVESRPDLAHLRPSFEPLCRDVKDFAVIGSQSNATFTGRTLMGETKRERKTTNLRQAKELDHLMRRNKKGEKGGEQRFDWCLFLFRKAISFWCDEEYRCQK
jgi:hypothetical protein